MGSIPAALMAGAAAGLVNFLMLGPSDGHSYLTDLGYNHAEMRDYQHVWCYTLLNLFFASFILMLISEQARHQFPWIRRLLESNWMVSVGKVSYGMYIFHWAIMVYVVERIFPVHGGADTGIHAGKKGQ